MAENAYFMVKVRKYSETHSENFPLSFYYICL